MRHRRHRGISVGTVFMLALTLLVLSGMAVILPRLMGTADISIDARQVFSALNLSGAIPQLSLSDIPISDITAVPDISATPQPQRAETPTPIPATPTPAPTVAPGGTVTLTFGGTVNIDDAIRKSAYYSDSQKYDFTDIFMLLKEEMQSDLTLVTLENLIIPDSEVSSLNAPDAVMDMLAENGVDMVALGFPKAYDKGIEALRSTIDAANKRGLTTIGAYATQTDAEALRIVTVDQVDIAFLHYTDAISSTGKKGLKNDGNAYVLPSTLSDGEPYGIITDMEAARQAGADVVIVSLNWGSDSASKPTTAQKNLAQKLADAGADVIVGSGTNVVQPVTWLTSKRADGTIRQTLCAWSLGSIINESRKDGNVAGMLLQLQLSFDGTALTFERVSYTPTYIWRFKQDGQYQYRVAVSDHTPPDGMSDDQAGYMAKALRNVQKYLGDSPITLRVKE